MDMHENELRGRFVAPLEVESASHLARLRKPAIAATFTIIMKENI